MVGTAYIESQSSRTRWGAVQPFSFAHLKAWFRAIYAGITGIIIYKNALYWVRGSRDFFGMGGIAPQAQLSTNGISPAL